MDGAQIEIFAEIKEEIDFKLYKKFKITYLCFQSGKKIKKVDTRNIAGFMFGGISSRFWFAKNIINLMSAEE